MSDVNYAMNKYRKQLDSNNNDHSTKWTPQYIMNLFGMEDYALREAFINIVASCNPDDVVVTDNPEDITVFLYDGDYPDKSFIDVYDVLSVFNITDPALQHGVKKILMCGVRGHKSKEVDLLEIISALSRA